MVEVGVLRPMVVEHCQLVLMISSILNLFVTITKNEINTILENAGIYLTLEAGDTAQLNIEKI